MGQAKQRGTYEERKEEAIKAGRVKRKFSRSAMRNEIQAAFMGSLFKVLFMRSRKNR